MLSSTFMSPGSATLLAALDFNSNNIGHAVVYVLCLIMCVSVHEFGHAYVADRLGDPLPRMQGRVTLNPIAHIDWLGTVIFPMLMALGVGIPLGWGKPVQWSGNPRHLTRRFTMRTIRLMVSVAGPAMNLLLALGLSILFLVLVRLRLDLGEFRGLIANLIMMNLGLMFFNLLPVPPLDGRTFLEFLPNSLGFVRDALMRYGGFIFLALVLLGSPLRVIMTPFYAAIGWYMHLLMTLAL